MLRARDKIRGRTGTSGRGGSVRAGPGRAMKGWLLLGLPGLCVGPSNRLYGVGQDSREGVRRVLGCCMLCVLLDIKSPVQITAGRSGAVAGAKVAVNVRSQGC